MFTFVEILCGAKLHGDSIGPSPDIHWHDLAIILPVSYSFYKFGSLAFLGCYVWVYMRKSIMVCFSWHIKFCLPFFLSLKNYIMGHSEISRSISNSYIFWFLYAYDNVHNLNTITLYHICYVIIFAFLHFFSFPSLPPLNPRLV